MAHAGALVNAPYSLDLSTEDGVRMYVEVVTRLVTRERFEVPRD